MMPSNVSPQFIWHIANSMWLGGLVGLICAVATGAGIYSRRKRSFAAACVGGFYASFPGGTLSALTCGLSQLLALSVTGLQHGKGSHEPLWGVVFGWLSLLLVLVVAAVTAIWNLPAHSSQPNEPTRFRRWFALAVWSVLGAVVGVAVCFSLIFSQDQSTMPLAIYPGIVLGIMSAASWHFATTIISRFNLVVMEKKSTTSSPNN